MVAPKLTFLKIILSALYLNRISFNCKIGGDSGSVSGSLSTTSLSLVTGLSSGLQRKKFNSNKHKNTFILLTVFPAS